MAVETICANCGKDIEVYQSRLKENNFCGKPCHNDWQTGENNPSWNGGKESVECEECGQDFKRYPSEPYKFCSMDCRASSDRIDTYDHHFYNRAGWESRRVEILERDSHECQWCGSSEELHVHHLRPVSMGGEKYDDSNLLTLCQTCHSWAHKAIDY